MTEYPVFQQFVDQCCSEYYPPKSMSEVDLTRIEGKFQVKLPEDYRAFMKVYGECGTTLELLDALVDQYSDLPEISEIFGADEIERSTINWRKIGLPEDCITFASNGLGDHFCFRQSTPGIWFYDHEFGTTEKLAESFSNLLDQYVEISEKAGRFTAIMRGQIRRLRAVIWTRLLQFMLRVCKGPTFRDVMRKD